MDVHAAPPNTPTPGPAGSFHSTLLRALLIVHLVLVPVMVFWYLIASLFSTNGPDYDPLKSAIAGGAMSGLFLLDAVLKVASLIALGRATKRVAWYLIGSAAVTVGYLAVIFTAQRSVASFAVLPLLLGGLLAGEFIMYDRLRRANLSGAGRRGRADVVVTAAGAVLAGLLASWIGVANYAWLPEYTFDEGAGLAEDALTEVLAGMEHPPVLDVGPFGSPIPETECDDVLFSEWEAAYVFESGSFEEVEGEIRDIWTELGYEIDASVTERDGLPHLEAVRPDGVRMTLMMGDRPASEGKVVLAAYSGCVLG